MVAIIKKHESSLGLVIGCFKTMITNEYIRGVKTQQWTPFNGKLWQPNYCEHVIRDEQSYRTISEYIITTLFIGGRINFTSSSGWSYKLQLLISLFFRIVRISIRLSMEEISNSLNISNPCCIKTLDVVSPHDIVGFDGKGLFSKKPLMLEGLVKTYRSHSSTVAALIFVS